MYFDWSLFTAKVTGLTGRVRCEKGWSLDDAWSKRLHDFDLWYIWAGKGLMKTNTATILLRPGLCFWMRPGKRYLAEQDESNRLGVTYIHFDLVTKEGKRLSQNHRHNLPPECFEISDNLFFNTVTYKIIQLLQADLKPSQTEQIAVQKIAELLLNSLLMDLDTNLSKRHTQPINPSSKWHQQMMDITVQISENLQEVPDIASLAQQLGCSVDHFSRLFKQVVGMGPQAFIIQAKVNRARYLLFESNLAIAHIAERLGYQDVYFFSRQFKQKTGLSPTAFKEQALKRKEAKLS